MGIFIFVSDRCGLIKRVIRRCIKEVNINNDLIIGVLIHNESF